MEILALLCCLGIIGTALPCVRRPKSAPPWPSLPFHRKKVRECLQKHLPPGNRLLEIGPGFSGIGWEFTGKYHVRFIEISLIPYIWCRLRALVHAHPVDITYGDALCLPWEKTDAVVLYQGHPFNSAFRDKLQHTPLRARPTWICSIAFPFQNWTAYKTLSHPLGNVYLYATKDIPATTENH